MVDFLSPQQRSMRMSAIRAKNTNPEIVLRKALHKSGIRFRLHVKKLPGRPDIVLPRFKTIIFVNGCFWHGHSCQKGRDSKTNTEFWRNKISTNRRRDARIIKSLRKLTWKIILVWECQIKNKTLLEESVARIINLIDTTK